MSKKETQSLPTLKTNTDTNHEFWTMEINWSNIPFFQNLTLSQIETIKKYFTPISYPKDKVVIQEGEVGDYMLILIEGEVKVYKNMLLQKAAISLPFLKNTQKVLAMLDSSKYPIFGEIALLDNDLRSASVITTTDSSFLKITRDNFKRLISSDPKLALSIFLVLGQRIAQRLRQANENIIKLTTALALVLGKS